MKSLFHLGASAFLGCALILPAQTPSKTASDSASAVGCLQRVGEGYTLLSADGNLGLLGADDNIAEHVGHTVKVSGRKGAGDITVDTVEMVSEDCDTTAAPKRNTAAAGATDRDRDRKEPKLKDKDKDKDKLKDKDGLTADDQGSSKADRETTAKIRRALVKDDSLSTAAHNVKIITRSGHVTLRGQVKSEAEKAAVQSKVEAVLGDADFSNQLTVKAGRNDSATDR